MTDDVTTNQNSAQLKKAGKGPSTQAMASSSSSMPRSSPVKSPPTLDRGSSHTSATDNAAQSSTHSIASRKDQTGSPETITRSPPTRNGLARHKSGSSPRHEINGSSPARSPRRSSREYTTPHTIRSIASPVSRASSRKSPFRREDTYSPSQQLQAEFARFHIDSQLAAAVKLDRKSEQLANEHNEALTEASTKHEEVLRSAQKARERLQLQLENEVIRRRLQEAEEVERIRREKIALEEAEHLRKLEAAKEAAREVQRRRDQARETAEVEEKAKAESQRIASEERRRTEDAENKRLAEEATRRKKVQEDEDRAKSAAKAQATAATSVAAATKPLTGSSTLPQSVPLMQWTQLEHVHAQYLDLHRRLKLMRKNVMAAYKQAKSNPRSQLTQIADMRRTLAKLLGQFTSDKAKNRAIRNQVEQIMATAWNITDIALDAKDYVLFPTNAWPNGGNTQVSGVFVYLVNILTKIAFESMGAASRQTAYNAVDYYGVVLSWIVSNSKFRLLGNSFADVIIAKFHASCPPLFGIYGPENTAQGRKRLGWHEEDNSQEHFDKVNALAIGWGALTLRDYTRLAGERSAIPAWHYWQAVACIVNVPPQQLTKTHGIALKGLIDQYAHLFVKFYGQAAVIALRQAVVYLPSQAPEEAAFDKVKVVRDNLLKRLKLQL